MMRKYRVLQIGDNFYPQEKRWFEWLYIDNRHTGFTWDKKSKNQSACINLEYAKQVIVRRKQWLINNSKEPIIHYVD